MSMKSTEVRNLAAALAAEADDLTVALVNGRLRHTCAGDPETTMDCHACEVAEGAAAVRRADR
jgi:hypothetical protein